MSETVTEFVATRRASWDALETLLGRLSRAELSLAELESLDRLYRRSAADLAHAQARHGGTEAHRYLNALCARAYAAIYQPPRDRMARVRAFYRAGFPRAVRAHASYVWASTLLFALGILLGAAVVSFEPQGAALLVPAGIRASVERREMWTDGLLSVAPPSFHASWIATNNLTVTLIAFASGIFFGLGTLVVIGFNGLHVGAIVAYCVREQMGFRAFSFMGAHGPVELTTIVLAGAAGLMVGHALVDPGELRRAEALRRRGVQAIALVVGSAPFLGLIGIVEGFVSPGDLFPGEAKIALGLSLGVAFWCYLLRAGSTGTRAASASALRAAR